MRGIILGYDPHLHTGAISGSDGQRYSFGRPDWQADVPPISGQEVEFAAEGDTATAIKPYREPVEPFSWRWFLFSLNGRIGRKSYWLHWMVPIWIVTMLAGMTLVFPAMSKLMASGAKPPDPLFSAAIIKAFRPLYILFFLLLWPSIATQVKRLHDRNRSAWFVMIYWAFTLTSNIGSLFGVRKMIAYSTSLTTLWVIYAFVGWFFGLWILIETLFLRGTSGANKYGDVTR